MRFYQHLPAFVDADREQWTVDSKEEVFQIPWVKQWAEEPTFSHFKWVGANQSMFNDSSDVKFPLKLMAFYMEEEKASWFVLGILKEE